MDFYTCGVIVRDKIKILYSVVDNYLIQVSDKNTCLSAQCNREFGEGQKQAATDTEI